MAITSKMNVLITIASDTAGASRAVNSIKLVQGALSQANIQFDKNSELMQLNQTKLAGARKGYTFFSGTLKNTKGKLSNFGFEAETAGKKINVLSNTAFMASGSIQKVGETSALAGLSIGKLAIRAAATIPIWLALRAAVLAPIEAFKGLISFTLKFDTALANIRIVAKRSKKEFRDLGQGILDLGTKFGTSFEDASNAAVLFAQQGRSTVEILQLLPVAAKASAISGRSLEATVEDLTAITKSYNLEGKESIRIIDAITAVQLKHAITAKELSEGLRKLSPVASSLNITFEKQIGLITAVVSQTRRTGAEAANALRTILTRLQGSNLSNIGGLAKMPVFFDSLGKATRNVTGDIRPLDDILGDLAAKWETLTPELRNAISVLGAGRRRITEFNALMQNWNESIIASVDALFSQGEAQRAVEIRTKSLEGRIKRLQGTYKEFLAVISERTVLGGFISGLTTGVNEQLKALVLATNPGRLKDLFNQNEDGLINEREIVRELNLGYNELIKQKKRLSDESTKGLSEAERKGVEKQVSLFASTTSKKLSDIFKSLEIDFKVDDNSDIFKVLDELKKRNIEIVPIIAQEQLDAQIREIKKEISELGRTAEFEKTTEGIKVDPAVAIEQNLLFEKIKTLGGEKALEEEILKVTKEINLERKEALNLAKATEQIKQELSNLELNLTKEGKGQVAINRAKLDLIRKEAKARKSLIVGLDGEEVVVGALKTEFDKAKLFEANVKNQQKMLILKSEETIAVSNLIALGGNEISIQKLKIEFAKERATMLGDETIVLKEHLKLQELIAEKQASVAKELQSTVASALKDVFKGEGDLTDVFDAFTDKIKDRTAEAFANLATEGIFGATGIGDLFGKSIEGIESTFDDIPALHKKGFKEGGAIFKADMLEVARMHAELIKRAIIEAEIEKQAIAAGGGGGGGAGVSAGGTISQLTALLGASDTKGTTASTGFSGIVGNGKTVFDSGGTNAFGRPLGSGSGSMLSKLGGLFSVGSQGKGFGSAAGKGLTAIGGAIQLYGGVKQAATSGRSVGGGIMSAAMGGAAIGSLFGPVGTVVGAVVGAAAAGIAALFRKSKRNIEVQEETRDIQIASKIDVTNNKLDIVNRNLISIKQSFDTYVLPSSAFFGEKRNLEDQFSIASRRGLS